MSIKYWVYTIGTRDAKPPEGWLAEWPHHAYEMWFTDTKKPTGISAGDRAIFYGSHGRGFLGAVEVAGREPQPNRDKDAGGRKRWPWVLEHRLLVAKAADRHIASPDAAGINARRIARGPHTEIGADEYMAALEQLLAAAAESAAP